MLVTVCLSLYKAAEYKTRKFKCVSNIPQAFKEADHYHIKFDQALQQNKRTGFYSYFVPGIYDGIILNKKLPGDYILSVSLLIFHLFDV